MVARFLLMVGYMMHQISCDTFLYVSSTGTDSNNYLCSKEKPCGTVYNAIYVRERDSIYSAIDHVEILVDGINEEDMNTDITYTTIRSSLTVTFLTSQDPQWYSIQTWYKSKNSKLILNNLYYTQNNLNISSQNYYSKNIISVHNGIIIFNNCTFHGLNILLDGRFDEVMIRNGGGRIEIYDSLFSNITYTAPNSPNDPNNSWTYYMPTIISIDGENADQIILKNTVFKDIYLSNTYFIRAETLQQITVENCQFTDIYLNEYISLFYLFSHYLDKSTRFAQQSRRDLTIYIRNSSFHHINYGTILQLEYSANAVMQNVDIISSDFSMQDAELITVHSTAQISMRNIRLEYKMMDQFNDICEEWGADRDSVAMVVWTECHYPNRFINNDGYVVMYDVYITNDLTKIGLNTYRSYSINKYNQSSDVLYIFMFMWMLGFDIPSITYNSGMMKIDNMTISGVGVHELEFQNKGAIIMQNINILKPDYMFSKSDFIAIDFNTAWPFAVVNEGSHGVMVFDNIKINLAGFLMITDAHIDGKGAVLDYRGYVGIYNTYIGYSTYGITAFDSISFEMTGCYLNNLGAFHVGPYNIMCPFCREEAERVLYIYNAQSVVFENNIFNYFADDGYLLVKNYEKYLKTNVKIKKNTFLNPVTADNFGVGTLEEKYKKDYKEMFNWTENDGGMELAQKVYNEFKLYGPTEGHDLIHLEGYIESSFIGNEFGHNDILTTVLNKSCLYIDGYDVGESKHCVSGNIFYGSAIKVFNATIISCVHPGLSMNGNVSCWTETGATDMDDMENIRYSNFMIATDIHIPLLTIYGSKVILDMTIIQTEFNDTNHSEMYNPLSVMMDGMLSVLDMIVLQSDHPVDIQFYDKCNNLCSKFYLDNPHFIHQFHINCHDVLQLDSSIIGLSQLESKKSVNHTLAAKVFLNSSRSLYPGGTLDIEYIILDAYNYAIPEWEGELFIRLTSYEFGFDTTMHINSLSSPECDVCETGLYIQNARIDNHHIHHIIFANVVDNLLIVNDLNVTISECPPGFGLHPVSSQCYECNIGEFSIEASELPCISCNVKYSLKGIECIGKDKVMVSENYWMGVHYADGFDIVSTYCPASYCSQRKGDYLELRASKHLCASNRDPDAPLCGQCIDGFSELLNSSRCGKCPRNRIELWFASITFSIVFGVLVLFGNGLPKKDKEDRQPKCCFAYETRKYIPIALQKPILYHYQSLTFIFLNTGLFVQIMTVLQIFNFQFDVGSGGGYCWVKGLTAQSEIMLNLIVPTFALLTIVILNGIHRFYVYKIHGKTVFFGKAYINILLLVITTFCGTCFKLMACRTVGNDVVHFYFGTVQCYDVIWYVAVIVLAIVLIGFCSFFVKLCRDRRDTQNIHLLQRKKYIFQLLVKSYKIEKYWYWEMIMFSRRFVIAMINALGDVKHADSVLFTLILLFLMAHIHCKPFNIEEINTLETVCMLCLLSVLYLLSNAIDTDSMFSVMLLNVIILLPLVVFAVQIVIINYQGLRLPAGIANNKEHQMHGADSVESESSSESNHHNGGAYRSDIVVELEPHRPVGQSVYVGSEEEPPHHLAQSVYVGKELDANNPLEQSIYVGKNYLNSS